MYETKKLYQIRKIDLDVNPLPFAWESIPEINIDCFLWEDNDYKPKTKAKLFYTDTHFHVFFKSFEEEIKVAYFNMDDDVYKDSCVEFFIKPNPDMDDRYFNFEMNSVGALLLGLGVDRYNRERMKLDNPFEVFGISTSVTRGTVENYNNQLTGNCDDALPGNCNGIPEERCRDELHDDCCNGAARSYCNSTAQRCCNNTTQNCDDGSISTGGCFDTTVCIPSLTDDGSTHSCYNGKFWTVEYSIPFSFIEEYFGKLDIRPGFRFKGNFYKCGDETKYTHYGCWNPIKVASPDFHRPEFFGDLVLE